MSKQSSHTYIVATETRRCNDGKREPASRWMQYSPMVVEASNWRRRQRRHIIALGGKKVALRNFSSHGAPSLGFVPTDKKRAGAGGVRMDGYWLVLEFRAECRICCCISNLAVGFRLGILIRSYLRWNIWYDNWGMPLKCHRRVTVMLTDFPMEGACPV